MSDIYQTEEAEQCGITVRIDYYYDQDAGKPWVENDGHGIIRETSSHYGRPDKKPGEIIIASERGHYWLYDIQETTKIATRDSWGISPDLAKGLAKGLTKKQIVAASVKNDVDFCSGYLNDQWHYVGVVCTVLDKNGDDTDDTESCWGFETYKDYHETAGREMAADLAESTYKKRLAQWRAALHESRERKYWNSRDVETVAYA